MPSAVICRRNVFSQMSERMSDGGKIGWNDWKSFPFDCCAIHCLPSAWKNVLRDIGESRYHAHYIRFSSFWRSFPIGSAAVYRRCSCFSGCCFAARFGLISLPSEGCLSIFGAYFVPFLVSYVYICFVFDICRFMASLRSFLQAMTVIIWVGGWAYVWYERLDGCMDGCLDGCI